MGATKEEGIGATCKGQPRKRRGTAVVAGATKSRGHGLDSGGAWHGPPSTSTKLLVSTLLVATSAALVARHELVQLLHAFLSSFAVLFSAVFWAGAVAWAGYCYQLEIHPITTKLATSFLGCIIGDLIAQVSAHMMAAHRHHQLLQGGGFGAGSGAAAAAAAPSIGTEAGKGPGAVTRGGVVNPDEHRPPHFQLSAGGGVSAPPPAAAVGWSGEREGTGAGDGGAGPAAATDPALWGDGGVGWASLLQPSSPPSPPPHPHLQQQQQLHQAWSSALVPPAPRFRYDIARISRLLLFTMLTAPIGQFWFLFLDSVVLPDAPAAPQAVFTKVALDQLCMAPVMTLVFFAAMRAMEDIGGGLPASQGRPTPGLLFRRAKAAALSKIGPTMKANYAVWPLAHVINFALVPSSQRILYVTAISIVWTAFISWQMSNSPEKEGEGGEQVQAGETAGVAGGAAGFEGGSGRG